MDYTQISCPNCGEVFELDDDTLDACDGEIHCPVCGEEISVPEISDESEAPVVEED